MKLKRTSIRLFSLILASAGLLAIGGCAAPWTTSAPEPGEPTRVEAFKEKSDQFFKSKFGSSSGVDPRAREIERRLGY